MEQLKGSSTLHLNSSQSPLEAFPQLSTLENHNGLCFAAWHLPGMKKFDVIFHGNWKGLSSSLASCRGHVLVPCTLLPVIALKKRSFLPKVFFLPSRKGACKISTGWHLQKGFYSMMSKDVSKCLCWAKWSILVKSTVILEDKLEALGKLFHLWKWPMSQY